MQQWNRQPEMYAVEKGTPVGRPGEGSPALRGGSQGASLRDAGKGPTGEAEVRLKVIPIQEGNRAPTPSGRALVPSPGSAPTDAAARRPDTPSALPTRCDAVGYLTAGCSLMGAGSKAPQRIDFVFLIL